MAIKTYVVETISTAGVLGRARAVQADDAQEAAQIYCRADSYADIVLVGEYRHHGLTPHGSLRPVGGREYRHGDMHVRVTA